MRLSFVNEATRLSSYSGANLVDVLKGVGLDSRIGSHYFRPSPSWGGSCFPKDLVEVNDLKYFNWKPAGEVGTDQLNNYVRKLTPGEFIRKLNKRDKTSS